MKNDVLLMPIFNFFKTLKLFTENCFVTLSQWFRHWHIFPWKVKLNLENVKI